MREPQCLASSYGLIMHRREFIINTGAYFSCVATNTGQLYAFGTGASFSLMNSTQFFPQSTSPKLVLLEGQQHDSLSSISSLSCRVPNESISRSSRARSPDFNEIQSRSISRLREMMRYRVVQVACGWSHALILTTIGELHYFYILRIYL
jgi:alpha-tubulin suppressor-like RCC1 family protein